MVTPPPADAFAQVLHRFMPQSRLLRYWPLQGGVSAQITALEIQQPNGQNQKLVVRQYGPNDLQLNPPIAAQEFHLLQILQSANIAAPQPYFLDESRQILPTPCIVIEYIEGQTEFAPADLDDNLGQMARQLARIHTVTAATVDLSFLPLQSELLAVSLKQRPAQLDDSLSEGPIRAGLEAAFPWPQPNPVTLLHGDFWPGNLLWQAGQLRAVIDWEDARVGDPLSDLANARLELLWAFGLGAMQAFTKHYRAITVFSFAALPYWDLYAALRPASKLGTWGLEPATEAQMRYGHKTFVTEALHAIGFASLSNGQSVA